MIPVDLDNIVNPVRSCLEIPIPDQFGQRFGNCSVIVTEKHLDGRGPLGLTIIRFKSSKLCSKTNIFVATGVGRTCAPVFMQRNLLTVIRV